MSVVLNTVHENQKLKLPYWNVLLQDILINCDGCHAGFVRSIVLGAGQPVANILQDTLRLITLWFSYGTKEGKYTYTDTVHKRDPK